MKHKWHFVEKGYRFNPETGLNEVVYEFICGKCGKVKIVRGE